MDDFVLETDCAAGRLGDSGGVLAANRGRSGARRGRGRSSGTAASIASVASIASQDDHG